MTDETNVTRLALRADMNIDKKDVTVEGIVGGDFFLQLSEPASLGTPISFAYWLHDDFAVEGEAVTMLMPYPTRAEFETALDKHRAAKSDDQDAITELETKIGEKVPANVKKLMTTALLAKISIEELLIAIKAADDNGDGGSTRMKFGLSVDFGDSPLELLPTIKFTKLSLTVMNFPVADKDKPSFGFPPRTQLPRPELIESEPEVTVPKTEPVDPVDASAQGTIEFDNKPEDGGTVTFGTDIWTFKTTPDAGNPRDVKIEAGLPGTIAGLVKKLNTAEAASDTAKCKYEKKAKSNTLTITHKTPGSDGKAFAIDADVNSNGKVSGKTLSIGSES